MRKLGGDWRVEYYGEIEGRKIFVGVAEWRNGWLNTEEDPDGWSEEDEVKSWEVDGDIVAINLGDWG